MWLEISGKTKDHCIKESGVEKSLADNVLAKGEFPDEPKLKCYIKCQNVINGYANDDGDFILKTFENVIGPEIWEDLKTNCLFLPGKNSCDRVYNRIKCTYKSVKIFLSGQ